MLSAFALAVSLAASPSASARMERMETDHIVGGAFAPAALPAGTLALWGVVGAPDVGVGYRQGFSRFELEAKATFNLFEASTLGEIGARIPVLARNGWLLAPTMAMGLWLNSGSTHFDPRNFSMVALRPRVGAVASYLVNDRLQLLGLVDVPVAFGFSGGSWALTPQLGAGAELSVGGGFSVLGLAAVGLDSRRAPDAVVTTRAAWSLRLGVGYRLF